MVKVSRILISLIIIVFSLYGLFSHRGELLPYLALLFGLLLAVTGVEAWKVDKKKGWGTLYFTASLISFIDFFTSSVFQ